jgi:hypothetical protein
MNFAILCTDGGFRHRGRDTEIAHNLRLSERTDDHSLESSWGALSDGTISCLVCSLTKFWGKSFSDFFPKNHS